MKTNPTRRRRWKHDWWLARSVVLALLTPLLEKNPSKTRVSRCHVPVVLSMARLVVLLFAAAMLRQIYLAGIAGWPEATLSIAVVLAIPLLSALERIKPEQTVRLMQSLFRRVGDGATRAVAASGSVYPSVFPGAYASEPSKFDDHSADDESRDAARPRLRAA